MTVKVCRQCEMEKSTSDFYRDARNPDGLIAVCKPCHIARTRKWQAKVGAVHLENCRAYRRANPERQRQNLREWRASNRQRYRDNERQWRAKNSVSIYARNAERTKHLQRATPAWADRDAIAAVYAEARRLTEVTGQQWHVDHIVPLRGKTVSGLHVAYNLRAVPAVENVRKGNRLLAAA